MRCLPSLNDRSVRRLRAVFLCAALFAAAGTAYAVPSGKIIEFGGQQAGAVVFDGRVHAQSGARCSDCHPAVFKMKRGSSRITMRGMESGEYCGRCHNGSRAFSVADAAGCGRCHAPGGSAGRPAAVMQRPAPEKKAPADEEAFRTASVANTMAAYDGFLDQYPRSPLRPKALAAMAGLIQAGGAAAGGYSAFLTKYPDGAAFVPLEQGFGIIGPPGLTVLDIINEKKQGTADRLIISKIRSSKGTYKDFSFDEIKLLHEKGLSDDVIEAMIDVTAKAKGKTGP